MSDWKPMKDAPADGSTIVVRASVGGETQFAIVKWDDPRKWWVHADGGQPYPAYDPIEWMRVPDDIVADIEKFKADWRKNAPIVGNS